MIYSNTPYFYKFGWLLIYLSNKNSKHWISISNSPLSKINKLKLYDESYKNFLTLEISNNNFLIIF